MSLKSVAGSASFAAGVVAFLVGGSIAASLPAGENEIPFSQARIYFELNDTDGDLGIHASIDGRPFRSLLIEGPDERRLLNISLSGSLRKQGLTELFFESAEPSFDQLPPERFFRRFPEGEYEVEGITLEGRELESEVMVTHLLPAGVEALRVNGEELPEDCDGELPVLAEPYLVEWDEVTHSHAEIGRTDEEIEVDRYEVIIESEETSLKYSVELAPEFTELALPVGLATSGDVVKVEVLVREAGGNQTAVESCFEVE